MAYQEYPQENHRNEPRRGRVISAQRTPSLLLLLTLTLQFSLALSPAAEFPLRWRWSNPAPHGNNVVDMAHSTSRNLTVQVAEQGQIYTSTDFQLWIPRDSKTNLALRAVTFLSERIIITGESGIVLYSDDPDQFQHGTLSTGPTPDWLEAVTASATLAVAAGDNGAIYTTSDGEQWSRQTTPSSTWLRGITFGNNQFVTVGELGRVMTSPDGTNWTVRLSGTLTDLNRVLFHNGNFIALGDNGTVLRSATGLTWLPESVGTTNRLQGAAINIDASVVVGDDVLRMNYGDLWEDQLALPNGVPDWTFFSAIALPNYFLVAGRTGMMAEATRTNGLPYLWREKDPSPRHWLFDMTRVGSLYATVGDQATVMTSVNGIDWSLELVPGSLTNTTFLGIGGTTNMLVSVGDSGGLMISPNTLTNIAITNIIGTNIIITNQTVSTLGINWYPRPPPAGVDFQGVSHYNGLFLISGESGVLYSSPDATNWTWRVTPTIDYLSSIAPGVGSVVATGDNGTIVTSRDGMQWNGQNSGTTRWLYRVRYIDGQFFAVGELGTLLVSRDGVAWNPRTTGTSSWLNDIVKIDDTYFIVGNQGTVLTSPDTFEWTSRGTITRKSLFSAATDGSQLIVSGFEGVILRSPVVPDPTPVQFLNFTRFPSADRKFIDNLYLFAGVPDQQFTLDYRRGIGTNDWVTGPTLEFLDSSGTFFYLEQVHLTNAPPIEFYRGSLPE